MSAGLPSSQIDHEKGRINQDDHPSRLDSLRPTASHALPNTIPPKPKTGRGIYVIWYAGFISLLFAVIFCFAVVLPELLMGQLHVGILAFLLSMTFGSLFLVLKKIIDIYNNRL